MTTLRAHQIQPRLLACALGMFLCMADTVCRKGNDMIVFMTLHPPNAAHK